MMPLYKVITVCLALLTGMWGQLWCCCASEASPAAVMLAQEQGSGCCAKKGQATPAAPEAPHCPFDRDGQPGCDHASMAANPVETKIAPVNFNSGPALPLMLLALPAAVADQPDSMLAFFLPERPSDSGSSATLVALRAQLTI